MRSELRALAAELLARARSANDEDFHWSDSAVAAPPSPQPSALSPQPSSASPLAAIAAEVEACRLCPLGSQRLRAVPGVGNPDADLMFVGEGPGYEEDRQGEPFVGKAGQLLDKMIEAIGLTRADVFIANIVKCHPMTDPANPELRGNDRPPTPEEMAACRPYLDRQIMAIKPKVIVALGGVSAKTLLGTTQGIMALRGKWKEYVPGVMGAQPIKLMPTYHPAFLLRDPDKKKDAWVDFKLVRKELAGPS